jgi:putative oxidoreductase
MGAHGGCVNRLHVFETRHHVAAAGKLGGHVRIWRAARLIGKPIRIMKSPQLTRFACEGYELLVAGASSFKSPFLLAIRLYWGWQMCVAGSAHLSDVPAMVERFMEWGVPFPVFNVYLSAITEIVCGLLLAAGVASRLIAIPLIINFCVAYLTASREVLLNIFNDPDAFVSDAAFLFLLASLIVFIFGPGAFSVDGMVKKFFGAPLEREGISAEAMPAMARRESLESLS